MVIGTIKTDKMLLVNSFSKLGSGKAVFDVPLHNNYKAQVLIDLDNNTLTAGVNDYQFSNELISESENASSPDLHRYSEKVQSEIHDIKSMLNHASRIVAEQIKYQLHHFDLSEELYSSEDNVTIYYGNTSFALPEKIDIKITVNIIVLLNKTVQERVQNAITNEETPLLALRWLFRCIRTVIPIQFGHFPILSLSKLNIFQSVRLGKNIF